MWAALSGTPGTSFVELVDLVRETGFGKAALLDSKPAWQATEEVYRELLPDGSYIDFFWSWRFLAKSLLAVVTAKLPDVRVFHAVATGFAGIVGAYAKHVTGRPLAVTEHGIYTNERRIELGVAEWIFDSGSGGFAVAGRPIQLRDVWLSAFPASRAFPTTWRTSSPPSTAPTRITSGSTGRRRKSSSSSRTGSTSTATPTSGPAPRRGRRPC